MNNNIQKPNNLCIIPARGGSKRIPRKNIRDFLGKPIIAYSIEAALKSDLFQEVMVSTDDLEIAEVAKKYGAKVPFMRSEENANDFAGTMDVIREVLDDYKKLQNKTFQYGCCIYPTAPLIQQSHILNGYKKMVEEKLFSVLPVVAFGYPVWRGLEFTNSNTVQMVWPENQNKRSQDLKPVYHDSGQWYWFDIANIKSALFTVNTGAIILAEEEVQDIDNDSDWKMAELKYKFLHNLV
ncbi:MAG: pseudaminic acid cytidylyltransferase [Bacteroidetes bacterium GWF2_38_335]|nr:MAG: pseudaminic acid cytidylyltransferase [Bacteroidetes bacterium GWF2_38_335]OFY77107.1 MAG: pseudaminic acid cytidylyltransferase [Bacteroidetes bacterium RIFOXYA12_FULL_38_20]HBS84998.1 pseudaminic acid cytidylyltransferase [Bacteroidales bacterium]